MRRVVSGLFVSLDGVVAAPETWTGPYFCPEVGQTIGELMGSGDTVLLGRVTYQTFAASFANDTSGNPMSAQFNAVRKVVVSSTLSSADWQNSTLVRGDVEAAVRALKQEDGRDINVGGSPTLVSWLAQRGLLDELDLLVFPLVVGHGRRLFDGEGEQVPLELVTSEAFSTGVVHLRYRLAAG